MRDNLPGDPMRAAQAGMRPAPIKRFYTTADVREADGLHTLTLDGRPARTPGKRPLAARRRARDARKSRTNGRGRARRSTRPKCR